MKADRLALQVAVLEILHAIAPELQADALLPSRPLRNQVDLDSMDWLNFLLRLHEHFKVDIPEADYGRLTSLDDVLNYLQDRLDGSAPS